jgi:hypothetical protein
MHMQVYITNRNWVTWPKAMAELLAAQGHEIIFIDNASTYEPLLDYYATCPFKILRMTNQYGNVTAWAAGIVTGLKEYHVVTDPDYDLSMVPSDWPQVLMEGFSRFPDGVKFGLSWDESQVPLENPAYYLDHMDKFPNGGAFQKPLDNNWYSMPIDTSFAIYKPGVPFYIAGIRKGKPYAGVHLPWHIVLDEPSSKPGARTVLMNDEILYYFEHCENSSFTCGRMIDSGILAKYKERKL